MHMPRFLIHPLLTMSCISLLQCHVFSVQCVDDIHSYMYIVQREKKTLGVKRLDLDAAKNHTKKQSGEKLQQVTLVVVHVVVSTHTQSTILQWKAHARFSFSVCSL